MTVRAAWSKVMRIVHTGRCTKPLSRSLAQPSIALGLVIQCGLFQSTVCHGVIRGSAESTAAHAAIDVPPFLVIFSSPLSSVYSQEIVRVATR